MKIINYTANHAHNIAELFYQSVHAIDSSVYSEQQKQAWAPLPIDYHYWAQRLARTKPYIAQIKDQIAGFIELEYDGHINCAYVAPEFQRQGIATALLNHTIMCAQKANITELYVEASTIAKPFFALNGFTTEQENTIIKHNTVLINYTMRLKINHLETNHDR
ncbi:GNAT family N-acetyltransferase [Algibacillus agarilyticus]|uniref:GNAT family N-acetyltransferase n=1 Tax=Algibacillus agarilyticus TaxID=2234133 RepID=UPI000DD00E5C|nr:GNAT family N-acetyltransferase [Algibacillus agarilyticus]